MRDLAKITIIGKVGRDPEMRYTANGDPVTSFTIAANRVYNAPDGERRQATEWFRVSAWRKLAETCNQFLSKGRRAYVEGHLRTRTWEGQDGQVHFGLDVMASTVLFLDRPTAAPLSEEGEEIEAEDLP